MRLRYSGSYVPLVMALAAFYVSGGTIVAKTFVQGAAYWASHACNYLEKVIAKAPFIAAINAADPTLLAAIPAACDVLRRIAALKNIEIA